ncbi:MAG: hypothetical protein PHT58_03880 [Eubacteriales bacterium]|nr:hypothetical protein [Eubacteriales bacterium]
MAGIFLDGRTHSAVFYGADPIKEIYRGSTLLWRKAPGNVLSLFTGEWSSFGVSVAVDDAGVVTLDGRTSTSAMFIRLTNSYAAGASSTVIADSQTTIIPANTRIRFYVESVGGSFADVPDSLNVVLRDKSNIVQFNCKLGNGIFSLEGVTPVDISCLAVYIRNTATCYDFRFRPCIEILA